MESKAYYPEDEEWIIWNSGYGVSDTVTIERVEIDSMANHRVAWLEEPYDMVGPFNFDELESTGKINFAACMVMSRERWQRDQPELRQEAAKNRRAAEEKLFEFNERLQQKQQRHTSKPSNENVHRQSLNLPMDGLLKPAQIKAAYRRLAQKAHPDVGGSHEEFVKITQARDVLLAMAQ